MDETWRGIVNSASLVRLSDLRRVIQASITTEIVSDDPEPATLAGFNFIINYPPEAFRGLTPAQAAQLVRVTGVGPIPPLETIGANVLAAWQAGATLAEVPG